MPDRCCAKECKKNATIRQPLLLAGEMTLHVPLCGEHSRRWESVAARLHGIRERARREQRDADWLLDASLALSLFPHGEDH
jgi:hypothetical protein